MSDHPRTAVTITGRLASGIGQGRHFTQLDWARRQFIDKLAIDPFPGTVNVIIEAPDRLAAWQALAATPGVRIFNPGSGPHDCDARCYPVTLDGPAGPIPAAIVLPEVTGYSPAQIELICAINVREVLGVADGAHLSLSQSPMQPVS